MENTYQLFLEAVMVAGSRTMCPPGPKVCLVPLAQGFEIGVQPKPPRRQSLPRVFLTIGPVRLNLKKQYSCEEQIMQLQLNNM